MRGKPGGLVDFAAIHAGGFDVGGRRGDGSRVVGVQAGPPPVPNRTGISSALKLGDDVYVIDCGLVGDAALPDLMQVNEIALPPGSDYRNRSPGMDPFPVVADDNVDVTATLVSHYDVYPAFGFPLRPQKAQRVGQLLG